MLEKINTQERRLNCVEVVIQAEPIGRPPPDDWGEDGASGALVEFYGRVRADEAGQAIAALHYEAYEPMATRVMTEKIARLQLEWPCRTVRVVHRIGWVLVGEAAIYVGIGAAHRREAFLLLQSFMDELKRDVPIWKTDVRRP